MVGSDGLFEMLGAVLSLAQSKKGITKGTLTSNPIERYALERTFLKGGPKGVNRSFQVLGVAAP